MSLEFKKLSEVVAVETVSETANVLIEENGVIKKAPKTEVGGAGWEVPDMVITIDSYPGNSELSSTAVAITEGSIDAVYTALEHGRVPNVKIIYTGIAKGEYKPCVYIYGGYLFLDYVVYYLDGLCGHSIQISDGLDCIRTRRYDHDGTYLSSDLTGNAPE